METLGALRAEKQTSQEYFSDKERQATIRNLSSHFNEERKARDIPADLVTREDLSTMLTPEEIEAVDYLMSIDPLEVGFTGPRIIDAQDARDVMFVKIEGQTFVNNDGEERTLPDKYLPEHTYQAIVALNERAVADGIEPLIIESGYRSPAYQAVVFLRFLAAKDFNIEETARRVALPGYSEHGSLVDTAVDLTTASFLRREQMGGVDPTEFDRDPAFEWLMRYGDEYGLSLSYGKDNEAGIQYEPWHFKIAGVGVNTLESDATDTDEIMKAA